MYHVNSMGAGLGSVAVDMLCTYFSVSLRRSVDVLSVCAAACRYIIYVCAQGCRVVKSSSRAPIGNRGKQEKLVEYRYTDFDLGR